MNFKLYWPELDKPRINAMISNYRNNCKKDIALSSILITDGTIIPNTKIHDLPIQGGVVDKEGYSVKEACSRFEDWHKVLCYEKSGKEAMGEKAIYLGCFLNQFGHFMLESLSKVWFVLEHPELIKQGYEVVFSVSEWGYSPWMNEFLELCGIKNARLISEPTVFKEIIIPESCSGISPDFFTNKFISTINRIIDSVDGSGEEEKIYFSRMRLRDNLIGEMEVQDVFEQNGFKVYFPEELTIREKIKLMKGCKEFAAVSGTTPLWLLFSVHAERAHILERFIPLHHNQLMVQILKDIDTNIICATQTFLPVGFGPGPCLVGLTTHLQAFLRENNFGFEANLQALIYDTYLLPFLYAWMNNNSNITIRNTACEVKNYDDLSLIVKLLSFTLFEEDPKKWLDYKLDKAIAALPEIEPRKKLHKKKEMREPFILRAISRKLRTLIG